MGAKGYKFTGAVAFLDILGFSDYFNEDEILPEDIRDKVIDNLIKSIINSYNFVMIDLKRYARFTKTSIPKLGWLYFSDSIILYLPLGEYIFSKSTRVIESIVHLCGLLMAHSIWLNIPLRGAISYGEYIVNHYPVYILGKPFIEAHQHGNKQNWAGISLSESALRHYDFTDTNRVVEYNVSCKNGLGQNTFERLNVVNWPIYCLYQDPPEYPDWEKCFECKSKNEKERVKVEEKKKNTKEFFSSQYGSSSENLLVDSSVRDHIVNWHLESYKSLINNDLDIESTCPNCGYPLGRKHHETRESQTFKRANS